jgi:hypothetical protein
VTTTAPPQRASNPASVPTPVRVATPLKTTPAAVGARPMPAKKDQPKSVEDILKQLGDEQIRR